MAFINVAEWTPGQVTDWLKGLDDSMGSYVNSFTNNEVGGRQLLNIRPYELEQLGMHSIGHQEIVLEAVENLRNIHYNLDKENLQFMALHVATAAHSLYRQLATHCYASQIETQILSDITRTIGTIKPLIGWLERAPFQGQLQFTEICRNMLRLGLEMATIAQRDRFVERPVEQIRGTAEKLDRLANYIIQDITDPMLLQPASLNLVTVKKRDLDPGFEIEPNYHGVHRISQIKYNSPAHARVEIEAGDEIVQIHYQTVVGWQGKTVWHQLHVSPPDVVLTLKKRPKHTNIYGQTYTQPFPLPSKKRVTGTRWGENLPSPRASFLTVPNTAAAFDLSLTLKTTIAEKITTTTSDSDSSENLTPTETKVSEKKLRLYNEKPRSLLQRRHTICGDMMGGGGEDLQRHKPQTSIVGDPASPSLRDKSKSFGYGLELASRPKTCIELSGAVPKVDEDSAQVQEQGQFGKAGKSEGSEEVAERQNTSEADRSKPGVCKVVRFDASMKYTDYQVDEKYTCNVDNTILETFEPIPFADEEDEDTIDAQRNAKLESTTPTTDRSGTVEEVTKSESVDLVEAINVPILARRARLDKSHSTPAYDNTGDECDTPPAIEPRKEFILQTPPVPPPRPRKQKDIMPPPVPPPPPLKPPALQANTLSSVALGESDKSTNHVDSVDTNRPVALTLSPVNGCSATAVSELHTPTKSRTLTLKKKHSLIAKRRNVNLKILGTGDIQGHLYRRTKDRRGVTFWARLYFVMLDTILYGFRSKEALKASCVIFLPGFTVSLAKEVHSKPHAFKVYHAAKTFYFAVESQDALNQWVELLRQATIQPHALTSMAYNSDGAMDDIKTKELFSETDSSGEESESVVAKNLCTPSPRAMTQDGIASGSIGACSATPVTSVKNERRYLGSLRKLTKGTLPFKSASASGEKKMSSDIPVPTDQYRSYRKVPGGSFGIQIGTNTPGYHMDPTLQLPLNTSNVKPPDYAAPQRKLSLSSSRSSIVSNGADSPATSLSLCLGPPSSPAPTIQPATLAQRHQQPPSLPPNSPDSTSSTSSNTLGKSIKKIPYNFLHASNPNLVEFDFQTSKTLDYSLPKINPANSWEAHHSAQSFITLKDLMLQKQKEEAQEMYNNRVLLGVERKDERGAYVPGHTPQPHGSVSGDVASSSCGNSNKLSKTQSRSLPKTPDYEISFKPDDEDIRRTRTKEGLKLRDFGYELIYGDEPVSTGSGATAQRQLSNVSSASSSAEHHTDYSGGKSRPFVLLSHKHKKHSSNSCSSTSSVAELVNEKRAGSFKKKSKSERIFQQFSKHASGGGSSASSGMTMTLPLNKKTGGGSAIKKSHTYNNDLKDKASVKYEAHRKNSAPMPIFTMLSTTFGGTGGGAGGSNNSIARSAKEKKILGSPLLHRTIFGGSHHQSQDQLQQSTIGLSTPVTPTCTGREYDREIFSQVIFPKVSSHGHSGHSGKFRSHHGSTSSAASSIITAPDTVAPPPPLPPHERDANANAGSAAATPEYPHMECPPVFEAEIYSLSESNANQTLLVRRKNSGSNGVEEK